MPKELAEDLREIRLEIVPRGYVAAMEVQSTLLGKFEKLRRMTRRLLR